MRRCPRCKNEYPLTAEYFHKTVRESSGFHYACKRCRLRTKKERKEKIKRQTPPKPNKAQRNCLSCGTLFSSHVPRGQKYCSWSCFRASFPSENNRIAKKSEQARNKQRRYRSSPEGALNNRMRVSMWQALRDQKGGRGWESLVGYSLKDLMKHIEKHFPPGMAWENRNLWHIDHVIPKVAFNYSNPEDLDFKKCWSLKNLRPIWAKDNLSKNAKITKPFQPSLAM
jgi:hypothetical protein